MPIVKWRQPIVECSPTGDYEREDVKAVPHKAASLILGSIAPFDVRRAIAHLSVAIAKAVKQLPFASLSQPPFSLAP